MRLLVDTSAYSAYLRGHQGIGEEIRRADELFVNPAVLGELLSGFREGTRYQRNLSLLRRFLAASRVHALDLDDETADRYSIIHAGLRRAGRPIPTNDLWIAASAMQHGLTVLTTDPHYERIPQIATSLYPADA